MCITWSKILGRLFVSASKNSSTVHVKDQGCARHRANHLPKYVWKQHVYIEVGQNSHILFSSLQIQSPKLRMVSLEPNCNAFQMWFNALWSYPHAGMPGMDFRVSHHRLPNLNWEALCLFIGYYGRLQVISIKLSIYIYIFDLHHHRV